MERRGRDIFAPLGQEGCHLKDSAFGGRRGDPVSRFKVSVVIVYRSSRVEDCMFSLHGITSMLRVPADSRRVCAGLLADG